MSVFQPWQLVLVTLAGWIDRQQQDVIAYLQEENRVLKSKFKGKRIRLTDDERRRHATCHDILHFHARVLATRAARMPRQTRRLRGGG